MSTVVGGAVTARREQGPVRAVAGAGQVGVGRLLDGERRAELAGQLRRRYEQGASVTDLARGLGGGRSTVHALLLEAGTVMRARPVLAGGQRRRVAWQLRQRYEAGASLSKLAAATGYSQPKVYQLLREAGTRMRPPGHHRGRPGVDEVLTGADRRLVAAGLRQRYEAGGSIIQLAAAAGYSYQKTRTLLRQAGTVMRPAGSHRPRPGAA